jgi:predicted PhzF superfamily epimerase YddE/YHI9
MELPLWQVDAFTDRVFAGNPAAVVLLPAWPDDAFLRDVAAENNLSETAFLVRRDDAFEIRWFTPVAEVALCGHATLASAFVVFRFLDWKPPAVRLRTRRSGELSVARRGDLLEMDFPAPPGLAAALGAPPLEVHDSEEDLLAVFGTEREVRDLHPDFAALAKIGERGVLATAPGSDCDFVSRCFFPRIGIPEDPVTGSAHCVLVPYWSKRLGRTRLRARQVSARGGELLCEDRGARVSIAGRAALYLTGSIADGVAARPE